MRIPRLKVGDAVEVKWLDSHFNEAGWQSETDLNDGGKAEIRSVCIYVGKDKNYLHTVADRSTGPIYGIMRDLKIPIGCIKSIRRLT